MTNEQANAEVIELPRAFSDERLDPQFIEDAGQLDTEQVARLVLSASGEKVKGTDKFTDYERVLARHLNSIQETARLIYESENGMDEAAVVSAQVLLSMCADDQTPNSVRNSNDWKAYVNLVMVEAGFEPETNAYKNAKTRLSSRIFKTLEAWKRNDAQREAVGQARRFPVLANWTGTPGQPGTEAEKESRSRNRHNVNTSKPAKAYSTILAAKNQLLKNFNVAKPTSEEAKSILADMEKESVVQGRLIAVLNEVVNATTTDEGEAQEAV